MPDLPDTHRLCESAKTRVRTRILNGRGTVGSATQAIADAALVEAVLAVVRTRTRAPEPTVAGYVPLPREPGGPGLVAALAAVTAPGRLLLPVLTPDYDLDWATYLGGDSLRPATQGLLEPAGPRLGPEAIATADVVIVPALAVDATGMRLGRGGGSYDRALARVPAGVATVVPLYAGEFVTHLPSEPHDRRVSIVLVANGPVVRTIDRTGR